jgi:hypothetical protein
VIRVSPILPVPSWYRSAGSNPPKPSALIRQGSDYCPSGTNGSQPIPGLHLLVRFDKKMIEILDADQAEPRIFHVRNSVECDRQGGSENYHMDPAARSSRGHAEAGLSPEIAEMLTEVAEAMLARHELAPFLALAPRWAAYRFQCHHNLPGLAPKDVFIAI